MMQVSVKQKAAEKSGLIQRKRLARVEAFRKKENQCRLDTFVYTLEAASLFNGCFFDSGV